MDFPDINQALRGAAVFDLVIASFAQAAGDDDLAAAMVERATDTIAQVSPDFVVDVT